MKKIFFLLFILLGTISQAQVNVVGYIQTNGVANYPTHIDSMGKGGYMVAANTTEINAIPCLRRKYGMAVYVQDLQKLYILKDSNCNNIWVEFSSGGGGTSTSSSSFGSFYDSTTQTIASTTTAYPIKITKIDTARGFSLVNNKIIADSAGVYNMQWSGQFQNTDNAEQDATVWIRKNGTDVVGSAGYVAIPKERAGINGHAVVSWNYIITMAAGDSIVWYWRATNTAVSLQYYPQQTSPTRPSTASVIVTITPATGGGGGGGSALTIKDEGTSITSAATSINFKGSGVSTTALGTDVTVDIPGTFLSYGYFIDTTNQEPKDTVNQVLIGITEKAKGFKLDNNQITADTSGSFNFQISITFIGDQGTPSGTGNGAWVWAVHNGVKIPYSTKYINWADKFTILTFNNILDLNKGDSVEYYWISNYIYPGGQIYIGKIAGYNTYAATGASVTLSVTSVEGGTSSNSGLNGVQKIIAGTNVTISPLNGIGDVTINATGGGGGSSRIDDSCVSDSRKFKLPNTYGYFMIANKAQTKDWSASETEYDTIFYPGVYQYENILDDKTDLNLSLPDPSDSCLVSGQRLIITNKSIDTTTFPYGIRLDQTYPIYHKGTSIPVTIIAPGETAEFYSDGLAWRRITSDYDLVVKNIATYTPALGYAPYYLPSSGTFNITAASNYPVYFPSPCDMPGSVITLRNQDGSNNQDILTTGVLYSFCSGAAIVDASGNPFSNIPSGTVSSFIAINNQWVRF